MCKTFGVDIGNSDLKIVSDNDYLSVKNIIAPGRERRIFEQEKGELLDLCPIKTSTHKNNLSFRM